MNEEPALPPRYLAIEKANRDLEALVYSVSHDLKSPLIALLGYLDYFRQDYGATLPDEAQFFLDRMSATGTYMQSLIQGLLELSRVGRTEVASEAVDLSSMLTEIVGEVGAGGASVTVEVGPMPVLWIDPVRARQLLTNLVNNAVRHAGRPQVGIRISAEAQPDGAVVVMVDDDGPGIAPEHRQKVFAVFERLDGPGGATGGTGIGLAICHRIMDQTGGSIWVADSDVGTRVCAFFPPAAVHRQPVAPGLGASA